MKKVIGKTLSAALALAMTVSLAACGSGNQSESSSSSAAAGSSSAAAPSTAASGDPVKLSLWHIQTTEPMTSNVKADIDRFTKENPKYSVDVQVMQNDAYKTKLKIALSSNTAPDIFFSWTGGSMNEYVDADKIVDLTPYMDKDNYKERFMDAGINQATYKDKIWGVPVENTAVAMFFYNKDLFAKYNLQVPKTIKELETV